MIKLQVGVESDRIARRHRFELLGIIGCIQTLSSPDIGSSNWALGHDDKYSEAVKLGFSGGTCSFLCTLFNGKSNVLLITQHCADRSTDQSDRKGRTFVF